jgi:hypothetical protein
MKSKAAFDLDGVLLNADEIFRDHLEIQGYKVIENNKWIYETDPAISKDKLHEFIDDCLARRTVDMDTFEGVEDLVQKLYKDTGSPLNIVTARNIMHGSTTLHAVNRITRGLPFTVSFAKKSKLEYLGGYSVFVEDRLETCIELASARKVVICPKRRWNFPVTMDRFTPTRNWTWMEESDLQYYGLTSREEPPNLFWQGRIIFIESMESFLSNEKLYRLLAS